MNFVKKVVILTFLPLLFSSAVNAEQFNFSRNLKIGMVGDDVRQLQIFLNKDNDTKVAIAGIGSPGQESTYFGTLTQKAVVRYQEKYSEFILIPNGLSFGTGFVGPSTISFLMGSKQLSAGNLSSIQATSTLNNSEILDSTVNIAKSIPANIPSYNRINLDKFISTVEEVSKNNGVAVNEIARIKELIYKEAATTTNLMSAFEKIVLDGSDKSDSLNHQPLLKRYLGESLGFFDKIFRPKTVMAQGAGFPFGGKLIFSLFCSCSGTWLITLQPLPPTMVKLLDYRIGSQAFLSFNIPMTSDLLGFYNKQGSQCRIQSGPSCVTVSSEGMIMPMVGSSSI